MHSVHLELAGFPVVKSTVVTVLVIFVIVISIRTIVYVSVDSRPYWPSKRQLDPALLIAKPKCCNYQNCKSRF